MGLGGLKEGKSDSEEDEKPLKMGLGQASEDSEEEEKHVFMRDRAPMGDI
jgi:hypothetical protein